MKTRILITLLVLTLGSWFSIPASAGDVYVTRYFSGLWDQPRQESQGIVLQIIDQEEDGRKKAVAYWFTYGDALDTAWYMAIGVADGDRVVMKLYTAEGVGFMEDDAPGNEHVYSVGTLTLVFHNCNKGIAIYEFDDGDTDEFEIKRLAGLYNSRCSGGISDDTPNNAKPTRMEVALEPAREGVTGKGKAKFWERADRSDFHVSAEDIPDGLYDIMICDPLVNAGALDVVAGQGQTEFRSPNAEGKQLLNFDPRDCVIELHDVAGAVLSSGENVLDEKGNGNDGGGPGNGNGNGSGKSEIAVDLHNTGAYPEAEGEASYIEKNNSTEFEVEIKGVPAGAYPLRVGDVLRGEIVVVDDGDDKLKGKLRFSDPQKEGRELLNFEPRGKWVEVYDGDTIILEVDFPE
jgi:hypothetical protein